ncbi:MAG: molecular chaperone DnaJ, partial [Erysipelotrichaceae bacterium]
MAKKDYYEILGLQKGCSEQDIKKAYRSLAKKYHPDVNKEANAAEQFKEIGEAYEVLSDSEKRAQYDQFGHAAFENGGQGAGFSGGFGGFEDIFSSFFGGGFGGGSRNSNQPRKGQDRLVNVTIEFMEAVNGKNLTLNLDVDQECTECHGTGAYSKEDLTVCSQCHGSGRVISQQRTPFGVFQQETVCPKCNGKGKEIKRKCNKCHGSGIEHKKIEVDVKIPAGIMSGQQLRVKNKGEMGINGGPNGDLYVEVFVKKHQFFEREGRNIRISVPISAIDATLGCKIDVPTVDKEVELNIPEGTQPNT